MPNITKQGIVYANNFVEFSCVNPNIMPNSYSMPYGTANPSTGTWRNAGSSTMTKSRVLISDGMYGFQNVGIQTANDGSCYGIDNFPLDANTVYTISMDARIVTGSEGYAGYNIYNISSENGGSHTKIDKNYRVTPLTTEWKRCWYCFTTNSSTTRNIYIGITTGSTDVTTQMCKVKIEKGEFPTPWIPNTSDPEYQQYPQVRIDNRNVISHEFIEW